MKTIRKSIPALFFLTSSFFGCGDAITGVDQQYITAQFDLDGSTNPTILDVDDSDVCPKFEFDSTDSTSYFLRTAPDSPRDSQAKFEYATTKYDEDGNNRILKGDNAEGSTFELNYDPDLNTYELTVEYTCTSSDGTGCTNASFDCTGQLVE